GETPQDLLLAFIGRRIAGVFGAGRGLWFGLDWRRSGFRVGLPGSNNDVFSVGSRRLWVLSGNRQRDKCKNKRGTNEHTNGLHESTSERPYRKHHSGFATRRKREDSRQNCQV